MTPQIPFPIYPVRNIAQSRISEIISLDHANIRAVNKDQVTSHILLATKPPSGEIMEAPYAIQAAKLDANYLLYLAVHILHEHIGAHKYCLEMVLGKLYSDFVSL